MRRTLALLAACSVIAPPGAFSAEHVVAPKDVRRSLKGRASTRQADLRAVRRALSSPVAGEVAAGLGVRLDQVKAAVPALSDHELRGLAVRASRLGVDPAAGIHEDPLLRDVMVIFLIAATVAVLLAAVDD